VLPKPSNKSISIGIHWPSIRQHIKKQPPQTLLNLRIDSEDLSREQSLPVTKMLFLKEELKLIIRRRRRRRRRRGTGIDLSLFVKYYPK